MAYLWIANLIIVIHGLFILFVMFGGLLVLRWRKLIWWHVPAAVWGVVVELQGWICPLTPWENHFRRLAGRETYEGDFIGEYLLPLIYPAELTREMQVLFGSFVLLLNLAVYFRIWRSWKKAR